MDALKNVLPRMSLVLSDSGVTTSLAPALFHADYFKAIYRDRLEYILLSYDERFQDHRRHKRERGRQRSLLKKVTLHTDDDQASAALMEESDCEREGPGIECASEEKNSPPQRMRANLRPILDTATLISRACSAWRPSRLPPQKPCFGQATANPSNRSSLFLCLEEGLRLFRTRDSYRKL